MVAKHLYTSGSIGDSRRLFAEMLLELGYEFIVNSLILHLVLLSPYHDWLTNKIILSNQKTTHSTNP